MIFARRWRLNQHQVNEARYYFTIKDTEYDSSTYLIILSVQTSDFSIPLPVWLVLPWLLAYKVCFSIAAVS